MMSIESMMDMSRQIALDAQAEDKEPLDRITNFERMRSIPNLGDFRPAGWRLNRYMFCDKGFGDEEGRCLSVKGLAEICKANPDRGYAIIEEGQFQMHVGEFVRDDTTEAEFESCGGGEDTDRPHVWIMEGGVA